MTGFKDGAASSSPFGDDDTDNEDEVATNEVDDLGTPERSTSEGTPDKTDNSTQTTAEGLPWIYERDSITDDRKTVQLHLQTSTRQDERETKTQVEQRLGEDVNKADLREAALLVGLRHLDETADQLREWGYDYE